MSSHRKGGDKSWGRVSDPRLAALSGSQFDGPDFAGGCSLSKFRIIFLQETMNFIV
jgi:hypothetical protein